MQADLEDFKTGWYGLTLGLKSHEIDDLILALKSLKKDKGHFHFRSDYEGANGVGDIEIFYQTDNEDSNMELDSSQAIYAHGEKT